MVHGWPARPHHMPASVPAEGVRAIAGRSAGSWRQTCVVRLVDRRAVFSTSAKLRRRCRRTASRGAVPRSSPPRASAPSVRCRPSTPRGRSGTHACIGGAHPERPFLSPDKPGTHTPALLRRPDARLLDDLLASGRVDIVTLAPELNGAATLTATLVSRDVTVLASHSAATFDQALLQFDLGIVGVMHLFNAMSPLHHRGPGLPGAALLSDHACVGVVVDGAISPLPSSRWCTALPRGASTT